MSFKDKGANPHHNPTQATLTNYDKVDVQHRRSEGHRSEIYLDSESLFNVGTKKTGISTLRNND
jgi:hypothetical protein